MSDIVLFNHKINSIHRYHPWIFSGAIKRLPKNIEDGQWVEVFDESGHFLGAGHYSTGSIAVRLISFEPHKSFEETFETYLKKAIELRKRLGLWYSSETNAFRLIHGEGDRLPGLIVDIYDTTAVVQAHTTGMFRSLPFIASALVNCSEGRIQCVFNKSKSTLKTEISSDGIIAGETVCKEICEYGNIFEVDISS
ncbi:MAG: hypothetical protein NZ522_08885, partial [Chitinophagales bacterium]|nr:hypothetical protein [Chitinophagales bacterium]